MHELSLLNETVKTVEKYASEHPEVWSAAGVSGEPHIESLILEVGELSSAVPEYLRSMWPEAVRGTLLDGAALLIDEIPAVAYCHDCGVEFGFRESRGICTSCDSKNTSLKSGREFFVKELHLAEE